MGLHSLTVEFQQQNITSKMQGLSIASLKKHPALIPLFVSCGAGVVWAAFYTARLAIRNPDVTWAHVKNPHPQQEWATKQYKFYSPVRDYSTYRTPAPNFEDEEQSGQLKKKIITHQLTFPVLIFIEIQATYVFFQNVKFNSCKKVEVLFICILCINFYLNH